MMTKKKPRGRPKKEDGRIMVSQRFSRDAWRQFREYVESISPPTTYTAVMELALLEYMQRHPIGKRKE